MNKTTKKVPLETTPLLEMYQDFQTKFFSDRLRDMPRHPPPDQSRNFHPRSNCLRWGTACALCKTTPEIISNFQFFAFKENGSFHIKKIRPCRIGVLAPFLAVVDY